MDAQEITKRTGEVKHMAECLIRQMEEKGMTHAVMMGVAGMMACMSARKADLCLEHFLDIMAHMAELYVGHYLAGREDVDEKNP